MRQHVAGIVFFVALFVIGAVVQSSQFATQLVSNAKPGHSVLTPVVAPPALRDAHPPSTATPPISDGSGTAADADNGRTTATGRRAAVIWTGTKCLEGTTLNHPKVVSACTKMAAGGLVPHVHGTVNPIASVFCPQVSSAAGAGNAPCGQWAEGKFGGTLEPPALREALQEYRQVPKRCTRADLGRKATRFAFAGPSESEVLRITGDAGSTCTLPSASPLQALAVVQDAAAGRGVLFSGDSMMRQVFLRLIATIRGQSELLADHYFHFDAVYVVTADGHDALIAIPGNKVSPQLARRAIGGSTVTLGDVMRTHFAGYSGSKGLPFAAAAAASSGDGTSPVVIAAMFTWETKPSVHRKEFAAIAPRLHVASFMYWWQNKDPLSDLDRYTAAVEGHYAAEDGRAHGGTYVWLTTPWTAPKLFGGVEQPIRRARNDKAKTWVASLPADKVRASVLDFEAVADAKAMPKTRDGIHYMCIWTPKLPDVVTGMKDNGQGCRDPMNAAVVSVLLALIADHQEG